MSEHHKRKNKLKDTVKAIRCEPVKKMFEDAAKISLDKAKEKKKELKDLLIKNNKKSTLRELNPKEIKNKNVISTFESTLTRSLNLEHDKLTEDLIVVQTYFFSVLEDIIKKGFMYKGEKYVIYTASAGQIRTKKTVFIKESSLNKINNKLMAGLTKEKINEKGGINTNKFLAYLALNNSSTDLWEGFDIDKCIVVNDLETSVRGVVDYINTDTYEIRPQEMDVPVEHTDGCGMILPKLTNKKARMIRAPWVKGLLMPFPFDKFIREHRGEHGVEISKITDIYGKEYDIFKDNIQVIFTKSQFKMWKYYNSWDEYKNNFKKYNCEIGYCNEEVDEFKNANFNYQMLQTLSDMTDSELASLTKTTNEDIHNIVKDRDVMLKSFGVKIGNINSNQNYLQQALSICPELLQDHHLRHMIYQIRNSLITRAKSGKFEVNGTYTFISPDLYAFCQHLFLGQDNPKGLLDNGEVFCNIYKEKDKLDCLRSPHLYMEHAVKNNISRRYDDRYTEIRRWFITNSLYVSNHDMMSKLLMYDVDGDQSMVVADESIIEIAERNSKNIYPLYYEMAKAGNNKLNGEEIYKGVIAAYTGGNIGQISNDITKIWNSGEVGSDELEAIKLLTMENNFVIDYAKTLFKLERPKDKHDLIKKYTKKKVPKFFMYAKKKELSNVEPWNDCVVNRLEKIIDSPSISFKNTELGKFDYKILMRDKTKHNHLNMEVVEKYDNLNKSKKFILGKCRDEHKTDTYVYSEIRRQMTEQFGDVYNIVDNLVCSLFRDKKSRYKDTFWYTFGDILFDNLQNNIKKPLDDGYIMCEGCGKRLKQKSYIHKFCEKCWKDHRKTYEKLKKKEYRS